MPKSKSKGSPRPAKFKLYKTELGKKDTGQWVWRVTQGRFILSGSFGKHSNRLECRQNAVSTMAAIIKAVTEQLGDDGEPPTDAM